MRTFRLLLLASLVAWALPTLSSAAVITFEGFAPGTVFTNQDFGDGVTFAGAVVLTQGVNLNYTQFPPHSGVNVVYNVTGPMSLTFTNPVDFFSGYFTYNQPLVIDAYNSASALLGSASGSCSANYVGAGCGSPNEFLEVNFPGQISRVLISGGGGNNFTLDDASFTGSINAGVPEPGTIAMMVGGLGLVLFGRRKRSS